MAASKRTVSGSARATIDHDEIRAWVEQHGGEPAMVKRTRRGDQSGITGSGRPSRFNKLVGRETVEVGHAGKKKAVPRRWAKKGARTRAELEEKEAVSPPSRRKTRVLRGPAQPTRRAAKTMRKKAPARRKTARKKRGTIASSKKSTQRRSTASSKKSTKKSRARSASR